MNDIEVRLEEDAVPIVRVLGAQFQRSRHDPVFARTVRNTRGVFALASSKDPQSATIRVANGRISLHRGIASDARLVITTDFDDDTAKPAVKGLLRHPLLAIRAARILAVYPRPLEAVAQHFWSLASQYPNMPPAIEFHCTDDDTHLPVGTGSADIHFYGTRKDLVATFSGGTLLVQAMMQGRLKGICGLQDLARLTEVTKDLMLGRAPNE
ncbi:MAG: hypothetical protein WD002_07655 [Pseudomonadales bacterium]